MTTVMKTTTYRLERYTPEGWAFVRGYDAVDADDARCQADREYRDLSWCDNRNSMLPPTPIGSSRVRRFGEAY